LPRDPVSTRASSPRSEAERCVIRPPTAACPW
jgi:hypothetical protein